ncbi:MAG: helix-turn-helix transcriptional regulator [Clostridia bacterium]|nr:helix-turn-helix transcriptional regulator [Clostridia bacterium]
MGVSYKKLFDILEERNLNKYYLRKNGLNPKVVDALGKNKNVNVSTIMTLCEILHCQPGDLMEYVPDNPDSEK